MIIGTTIVGVGTGIGYAAIPLMIRTHTPEAELASANGVNTLFRSLGSSLASSIGGSILAANAIILGTFTAPSLTAYRTLFAICAGASLLAAAVIVFAPPAPAPARVAGSSSIPHGPVTSWCRASDVSLPIDGFLGQLSILRNSRGQGCQTPTVR